MTPALENLKARVAGLYVDGLEPIVVSRGIAEVGCRRRDDGRYVVALTFPPFVWTVPNDPKRTPVVDAFEFVAPNGDVIYRQELAPTEVRGYDELQETVDLTIANVSLELLEIVPGAVS